MAISLRLRIVTFLTVERFDLIWTALNGGRVRLPDLKAWDDPDFHAVMAPTIDINGSAGRQVEGFLYVAHFAWIPAKSFDERTNLVVPRYKFERTERGIRAEYLSSVSNYPRGRQHRAPPGFQWLRVFEAFRLLPRGGSYNSRMEAGCGYSTLRRQSAPEKRDCLPKARNFDKEGTVEDVLSFNLQIFNKDRVLVESQEPEELPLDIQMEAHIAADRTSIACRKLLKDMELGADTSVRPSPPFRNPLRQK